MTNYHRKRGNKQPQIFSKSQNLTNHFTEKHILDLIWPSQLSDLTFAFQTDSHINSRICLWSTNQKSQGSSYQMKGREGWRGHFFEAVSTFQQPGAVRYSYRTWWQQQSLSLCPAVINSFQTLTSQTINVVCNSLWSHFMVYVLAYSNWSGPSNKGNNLLRPLD